MSSVVYNTKSNGGAAHLFPSAAAVAAFSTPNKMFKYQNIAPAPTATADGKALPRKYTPRPPASLPYQVDQSHSVQRRNARERNRVKQVNNSFARLRQHIPQTIIADLTKGGGRGPHKKISKVDTLRIAVEYIRRLQDLVEDLNGSSGGGGGAVGIGGSSDTASISSFSSIGDSSSADSPTPAQMAAAAGQQLYYSTSSNSPLPAFQSAHLQQPHPQQQHQQFPGTLLTQASLNSYATTSPQTQLDNLGCHSPTTSFNSSMSFDSGTFEAPPQQLSPLPPLQQSAAGINNISSGSSSSSSNNSSSNAHLDAHLQLKFEPYDSFNLHEEDCTPDDEEILDYISLWQEQ